MSHPEFSVIWKVRDAHFFRNRIPLYFYLGIYHTKSQGLMFKEQFQVGDGMLTKVIGFAQKSIHPGLSRCAVPKEKRKIL
jgi:hypothetical protein